MKVSAGQVSGFLSKPDPGTRAILLFGPNQAAAREAAALLVKWALGPDPDPFGETILYETALLKDAGCLGDALEAQSLLGGASLVRVRIETEAAALVEILLAAAALLGKGAGRYAMLLVEAGDLPKASKIRAAFEAGPHLAALPFYEDSEQEFLRMARARLKEAGVPTDKAALEQFAALMPQDRALMYNEIEKLIVYAGASRAPLEAEHVSALLADDGDSDAHEAGQHALLGYGAEAALALSDLVGFAGVSALKALEARLLRLLEGQSLIAGGLAPRDVGGRLRPQVFWKEADSFEAQLRAWKPDMLASALDVVWRAQLRAMTAGAPQELIAVSAYRAVAGIVVRGK